MRSSSANTLMNTLVKRYNITPAFQANATPTPEFESTTKQAFSQFASIEHQSLKLKLKQMQRQNQALRQTVARQSKELSQNRQNVEFARQQQMENEKVFEQNMEQNSVRIKNLQNHNEALQQELFSVKQLLREQQALIIQLSSADESD